MNSPESLARGIAEQFADGIHDNEYLLQVIAFTLRSYGEQCGPTKKGHSEALPTSDISNDVYDGLHNLCNERIAELTKQRDQAAAEGYRRGVEEAAKIADEKCLGSTTGATNETCPTSTDIRALLQRGTGGGE